MIYILLCLSIALSTVRNLLSKGISDIKFGTKQFFMIQTCIFACGCIVLSLATNCDFKNLALQTAFYAMIYGALLIGAQYCYTYALKNGEISVCSTVYSLGFVFPTLSGWLFWDEKLTGLNVLGIAIVISTIFKAGGFLKKSDSRKNINTYIIPLICAMLFSGGLGIVQKLQQSSPYSEQKNMFVITAFALAAITSFAFSVFAEGRGQASVKKAALGMGIGAAFGFCNLLNTILAGQLDSAVFFPILNIGTILLSVALGIAFFKEKISKNDLYVIIMGVFSILLITL